MRKLTIGDVTITSIVERDGPWRTPEEMFPKYNPEIGRRHLADLDPVVFDPASGRMVITYQTFVVRTPRHTILVDTCTGEEMDALCDRYDGFYRFAKLLEMLAGGIADGSIPVPE